ncbi:MAG: hypothetical protein KC613_00765, partial [Myxococcales bacterium]|nr:hypothetical protein [Myxococcales bacterium]
EAPKGTRVVLRATTLAPATEARLMFGDAELPLELVENREISGEFVVEGPAAWRVSLTATDGDRLVESIERQVRLEVDQAPTVTLKLPAEDLELDDLRTVPVVFEARDDFGLTKVNVVIALAADVEHPEKVAQPAVEGRRYAGDEVVDLSVVQAQPGDRIALFVEAFDANDVDGPQRGVSATRYITVNDPKQKHFELSERLREVVDLLVTALADRLEIEFYDSAADLDPLPARIGKYSQSTEKASQALAAVVADMVGDPLTPEEVRLALAGRLGTLEERVRAEARLVEASTAALEAGTRATVDQVNKANERVVDAVEQAIVLVEAMVARLALEDMEAMAEELQAMRARLKDLIQQYKQNPDDKALKARIMREIQRLRQRMDAMRERMAQLRQKLPEEFLNLDGLKKDDVAKGLDKTKDQLAELEKMLEEGKLDEALAALEEMEQALDDLSNTLDKDMQELHENSDPAMQKAISELMDQAKDLQREQKAVSDETEQLKQQAEAELKRMLEEDLKAKLDAVNQKAAQLKQQTDSVDPSNLPRPAHDDLQFAKEQADGLQKALERQQLMEALEAAEDTRQHLRNSDQMSRYDPQARSEQGKLRQGEQLAEQIGDELRDMLRQAMQQAAQSGDPQKSRQLGQRQMQLAERAERLRQRVGEQAQQMPQLGQEAQQRIQQAGQAMQEAGEQLGQGRPGQARPGQQQAMSELDGMMQALQNANRPQRAQRGQDGKQQGDGRQSSRDKVKIPGAEDHTSPEAFRKELLEVMKDGAPKAYEQQVKRYYESLVE